MGHYYDWIDRKWEPIDHDRVLLETECREIARRGKLIADLLTEIEAGHGITGCFARLLVRALVKLDQELMNEHGRAVAEATNDPAERPIKPISASASRRR